MPLTNFNKYKSGKYGRRARCKPCFASSRNTSAQRTAKRLELEAKGKGVCRSCGKTKALSSFPKTRGKGVLSKDRNCKVCCSAYKKKYHANKNAEIKLFIYKYKLKHPCEVCGETDVEMLEFDHAHSKKFDISNGITKGVSMHLLKKELAKCQVLCANHHRKKTHAERNTWLHRLAKEG